MEKKKLAADEYIRSEWTDEENVTFRKINTEKNEHLYFLFVVQLALFFPLFFLLHHLVAPSSSGMV